MNLDELNETYTMISIRADDLQNHMVNLQVLQFGLQSAYRGGGFSDSTLKLIEELKRLDTEIEQDVFSNKSWPKDSTRQAYRKAFESTSSRIRKTLDQMNQMKLHSKKIPSLRAQLFFSLIDSQSLTDLALTHMEGGATVFDRASSSSWNQGSSEHLQFLGLIEKRRNLLALITESCLLKMEDFTEESWLQLAKENPKGEDYLALLQDAQYQKYKGIALQSAVIALSAGAIYSLVGKPLRSLYKKDSCGRVLSQVARSKRSPLRTIASLGSVALGAALGWDWMNDRAKRKFRERRLFFSPLEKGFVLMAEKHEDDRNPFQLLSDYEAFEQRQMEDLQSAKTFVEGKLNQDSGASAVDEWKSSEDATFMYILWKELNDASEQDRAKLELIRQEMARRLESGQRL